MVRPATARRNEEPLQRQRRLPIVRALSVEPDQQRRRDLRRRGLRFFQRRLRAGAVARLLAQRRQQREVLRARGAGKFCGERIHLVGLARQLHREVQRRLHIRRQRRAAHQLPRERQRLRRVVRALRRLTQRREECRIPLRLGRVLMQQHPRRFDLAMRRHRPRRFQCLGRARGSEFLPLRLRLALLPALVQNAGERLPQRRRVALPQHRHRLVRHTAALQQSGGTQPRGLVARQLHKLPHQRRGLLLFASVVLQRRQPQQQLRILRRLLPQLLQLRDRLRQLLRTRQQRDEFLPHRTVPRRELQQLPPCRHRRIRLARLHQQLRLRAPQAQPLRFLHQQFGVERLQPRQIILAAKQLLQLRHDLLLQPRIRPRIGETPRVSLQRLVARAGAVMHITEPQPVEDLLVRIRRARHQRLRRRLRRRVQTFRDLKLQHILAQFRIVRPRRHQLLPDFQRLIRASAPRQQPPQQLTRLQRERRRGLRLQRLAQRRHRAVEVQRPRFDDRLLIPDVRARRVFGQRRAELLQRLHRFPLPRKIHRQQQPVRRRILRLHFGREEFPEIVQRVCIEPCIHKPLKQRPRAWPFQQRIKIARRLFIRLLRRGEGNEQNGTQKTKMCFHNAAKLPGRAPMSIVVLACGTDLLPTTIG